MNTFSAGQISTMKGYNPRLKVVVYLNGTFAQSTQGPGTSGGYAGTSYANTKSGLIDFVS